MWRHDILTTRRELTTRMIGNWQADSRLLRSQIERWKKELFCSRRVFRSSIYFLYISIAGVYLRTGKGKGRENTTERGVKTFHLITASPVNIKYIPSISEKCFIKRGNLKGEHFDSGVRGQIEPAMKTEYRLTFLKYSSRPRHPSVHHWIL